MPTPFNSAAISANFCTMSRHSRGMFQVAPFDRPQKGGLDHRLWSFKKASTVGGIYPYPSHDRKVQLLTTCIVIAMVKCQFPERKFIYPYPSHWYFNHPRCHRCQQAFLEIHPPIRRTPAIHPILPPPHLAVVAAAVSDLAVVPEGRRQIAPTWLGDSLLRIQ